MKTQLHFNKQLLVHQFLLPLSKLTDNLVLNVANDSISAICSTVDAGVVVFAELKDSFDIENTLTINLPDIKKFLKLIDGIDEETVNLTYTGNSLTYSSKTLKFNYFLLEDGYVQRCAVSASKIQRLESDTSFTLSAEKLNEILRGHSIATDAGKVYFYLSDGEVYAELNDRERQNINNICYYVADSFEGQEFNPLALNLEALRMLTGLRNMQFNVKINNKLNVFLFDIKEQNTNIRFAISALVK